MKALSPNHWTSRELPKLTDSSFIYPPTGLAYLGRSFKTCTARGDFPGGPVVKTAHCHSMGCKFHPWSGAKRKRKTKTTYRAPGIRGGFCLSHSPKTSSPISVPAKGSEPPPQCLPPARPPAMWGYLSMSRNP